MLYPKDIEAKLGVDKIRDRVKSKCSSSLGVAFVDRMRFSADFDLVNRLLNQTSEFLKLIQSGESLPVGTFYDVSNQLKQSKVAGSFCSEEDILLVSKAIYAAESCLRFINDKSEVYPELQSLGKEVFVTLDLAKQIDQKIDEEARMRDNASPELARIRSSLKSKYGQVRKVLQSIFKSSSSNGYIPEGASLTIRDGRLVIPILAEFKRRVPGFVHDESASGGTVYLEPTAVLEGNNEIRELEYAEKREVVKILTRLTDLIREQSAEINIGQQYLAKLDFIRAKARYANEVEALVPEVHNRTLIDWNEARHPLLIESLAKDDKFVVPLDITLEGEKRVLVISGPNAGGKSVSLKTVGLLQYMLQCGMAIPLGETSRAGIFNRIFIDIGDEQSLENDLSTYSSHLKSMKHFVNNANNNTLCLIDEFGTGTDPQFGGAIAQAVLEELNSKDCYGVITTHYGNIKSLAEQKEGLVNGAMKYDMKKLQPLFQLEMGKPGSSFSLQIAQNIGLPGVVLENAKTLIGEENIDVEKLLNQLEKQKQLVNERDKKLREREAEVKKLEWQYRKLNEELEANKKQIIQKAKSEASQLLSDTNKQIEKTIRHIKSNKAQKSETKKARERLENLKDKVKLDDVVIQPSDVFTSKEIAVGDIVKVIDQGVTGEVISLKGNDIEVKIGLLKTKLKRSRLEKISKGEQKRIVKHTNSNIKGLNLTSKLSEFDTTLDIRGMRAEVALPEIERFLDEAILFGLNEVRVLHGKGNGVLRDIVRNYARQLSHIASANDEHVERGGSGITVMSIK